MSVKLIFKLKQKNDHLVLFSTKNLIRALKKFISIRNFIYDLLKTSSCENFFCL